MLFYSLAGQWIYHANMDYFRSLEPSPLDLLLEGERRDQLTQCYQLWKTIPKRIQNAALGKTEMDQTTRIELAGWKKKLRKIRDL